MSKKYIKKIEINSEEWKLYKNNDFDTNFYYDKKSKNKTYRYFYLNQQNRNVFNIKNNYSNDFKNIDYYMLRDYQKDALDYILKNRKIILNLPVRFGKSYLAVAAILNNKKNTIIFVDPNMIEEFKNIFSKHCEDNVFVYYGEQNRGIFNELNNLNYKIIITTEETFIHRVNNDGIDDIGLKNMRLIENIIVDEYHSFIKMGDKRYKSFKKIINKRFKNIDIFMLMSATPTNENIYNIFYPIGLLDKDFKLSDWREKCFLYTKDLYGGSHYTLNNIDCLKGIINDSLYAWDKLDPFISLQIKEIIIDQPLKIRLGIDREINIIKKQKINDDHRLTENIKSNCLPEKIKKAISILKSEEIKNKKIVIFTYFKESQINLVEDLKKENIKSEYINSDVTYKKRLKIIDEFQSKNLNVIIIEIKTAIGITLDKADIAIIICDEYEIQKYYQALGRIISTNYYDLQFKLVYLIYDKYQNSKDKINNKSNMLKSVGINYLPSENTDVTIYLESTSDLHFIKRLLGNNDKYKLFNKNNLNFNPKLLSSFEKIGLNYIFICDDDYIVKDMKLDKWKFAFITYSELFGVTNKNFKNIEEILLYLGCYKQWQIEVIKGCKDENTHYEEFVASFKNIESVDDEKNKDKLAKFLNDYTNENNYKNILDDLYFYIKDAILSNLDNKNFVRRTSNLIKSYFMLKIDDEFIKKYSNLIIDNLNKKISIKKINNFNN